MLACMKKSNNFFFSNLDPYIFQGYEFPDNELNGELLRVDIYATIGKKLQLRLNDDCMLLLLNLL
jgi:hypothetical protein